MAELGSVTAAPFDADSNAQHNAEPPLEQWQDRLQRLPRSLRVHLLGIGGAGLGPIARVLLEMGVQVSGSDRQASPAADALAGLGARIFDGQRAENLHRFSPQERPHVVLISSAVAPENPERREAERLGLPIVKRAGFLPVLLGNREVVAIAGSHGKTTTTGMTAHILRQCGVEPGYIIGADVPGLGPAAAGNSPWFVIEADEYDRMFWGLWPRVAVVTNIEWDHPDCFPTEAEFFHAFEQFLRQVRPGGHIVACGDDPGVQSMAQKHKHDGPLWIRYGTGEQSQLRAVVSPVTPTVAPDVWAGDTPVGTLHMRVPGLHNVRNALAAVAAAHICGVPYAQALNAVASYPGAGRRFEVIGTACNVTIIDDYGHHPTEVAVVLAAARSRYPDRTIHAVFQPHTYSRTRLLLAEMAASFDDADRAYITDIYPAREQDDGSVHARQIADTSRHPAMRYTGSLDATTRLLQETVQPGEVVITFSAGDGNRIGRELLDFLHAREAGNQTGEAGQSHPDFKAGAP